MHARFTNTIRVLAAGCVLLGGAVALPAQQNESGAPAAPDNTGVNKRDRARSEPTADQGKNNASDRELMQRVRRALMDDKSLSSYAHNVKIIAQNGKVTLKGPVRSDQEKSTIESKANEVAGAGNVTSELTVKAARAKKNKP
jgi:hyperosmotically inducible periplasmic protein